MHQDHPNQIDLHGRPCGPIGTAQRGLFATLPDQPSTTPAPTPAELDTLPLPFAGSRIELEPLPFPTPAGTVPNR